jgi:HD-like signal output (HDOD) protein
MQSNAWIGSDFTRAANETAVGGAATEAASGMRAMDIARQLHAIKDLPPMPKMAQEIFRLSSNPYAGARELAAIVQLDPSLAAQVMRYAASPFFSYQGKVDSIQTAISRVLGYDMVMNLALGLATAKPFRVQRTGPLGLDNFWRHATYTAAIAQALCNEVPAGQRPKPGLCYLAGLLHNFGHLLLGHLFKQEFLMLNEEVKKHPEKAVVDIEQKLLGIDHTEIGVWLMQAWGLPEEVIVATQEHHNPAYTGPFSQYSEIVMVADHMLRSHGMGDAPTDELPHTVLESLGLTEVQTLQVMNRVLEGCEGLNAMAQQLAA